MNQLREERPAQHRPSQDQQRHPGQVGHKQNQPKDAGDQDPAQVDGFAINPGCRQQEQPARPQTFYAAARHIDVRHAVLEYQNRIRAKRGNPGAVQPMSHQLGGKNPHGIANKRLNMIAKRQHTDQQQGNR